MRPVAKKTLATLVAEQIRGDIVRGSLRASHRLPSEQEMSAAFEVGRPTIREALRILEGQGWVQIKFSNGAYVADPESVAELLTAGKGRQGLLDLVELETRLLREQGREVPESATADLKRLREGATLLQIECYLRDLENLPVSPGCRYVEPDTWEEIRDEAGEPSGEWPRPVPEAEVAPRILAGFVGRCIGSRIGTPVQGWTSEAIESYLSAAGAYPLTGSVPYDRAIASAGEFSLLGLPNGDGEASLLVRGVAPEYAILIDTVLSLKVMGKLGRGFTTEDIGQEWLASLPYKSLLTAERQAYANLVRGLAPPATATYLNPWREWLGGTVRADFYGYVCPGDPAAAAELAFRDARLSHTKNGVYASMFVASAIAASFAVRDPALAVAAALSQVPARSRLHEVVASVVRSREAGADWKEAHRDHQARCKTYHRAHSLANAGRVAIGVLWGAGDFRATVCTSVMCGGDPDCAAAAAGSIAGVRAGLVGLPRDLRELVGEVVPTAVLGFHEARVESVAREAARIALAGGDR